MSTKIIVPLFIAIHLGVICGFLLKALWVGIFLWFLSTFISAFIINLSCFLIDLKKQDIIISGIFFGFFNGLSAFFIGLSSSSANATIYDILAVLFFGIVFTLQSLVIYLTTFACLFSITNLISAKKND